jgi:glucose-6-phosphate 1-dehydrogenase
MVIFGISGGLARKMTFRSLYRLEARGLLGCPVIGVAKDDWADDQLCATARKALDESGEAVSAGLLEEPLHPHPNQLILRIDPGPGLQMVLLSKGKDGTASRDVHLDLEFAAELGKPPEPYERLLSDALAGDRSLFTREDVVEETWRVLQPLVARLEAGASPVTYQQGSWGPAQADDLVRGHPPWHPPWLPNHTA